LTNEANCNPSDANLDLIQAHVRANKYELASALATWQDIAERSTRGGDSDPLEYAI